jgi:hypothetical protein
MDAPLRTFRRVTLFMINPSSIVTEQRQFDARGDYGMKLSVGRSGD